MSKILRFGVHYSWIFIFALITTIVTTQFSEDYPLWQRLILGVVVSLLYLLAAIAREFILNAAVFRKGNPIRTMTLFPFGGVYQENLDRVASTHLALQYLAKFLSNLALAAVFYGLYATFVNTGNMAMAGVTQWLAYIFAALFLFHFVPAFPLDGGDILRMVLWRSGGDYYKATYTASLIGWATGLFLVFISVLVFIITRLWMISLLIIVFGWVITIAAGTSRRKIKNRMVLKNIKAEEIMTREYTTVPQNTPISQLVRDQILSHGRLYIIVADEDRFEGLVTLTQIRSLAVKHWSNTTAGDLMIPAERIPTAQVQNTADVILDEMYHKQIDHIPVLKEGHPVGVVNRSAIMSLIRIRAGFGI